MVCFSLYPVLEVERWIEKFPRKDTTTKLDQANEELMKTLAFILIVCSALSSCGSQTYKGHDKLVQNPQTTVNWLS